MNKYKIQLKTNLDKEIIVNANNSKEAFDFVEKTFLNSNLLDFSNKDIETVKAKIIEKNDEKIEENIESFEENEQYPYEKIEDFLDDLIDEIRTELPKEDREFYCPECGCPMLIDDVIEEIMS